MHLIVSLNHHGGMLQVPKELHEYGGQKSASESQESNDESPLKPPSMQKPSLLQQDRDARQSEFDVHYG